MNKLTNILRYGTGALLLGGALAIGILGFSSVSGEKGFSSKAFADGHRDEHHESREHKYPEYDSYRDAEKREKEKREYSDDYSSHDGESRQPPQSPASLSPGTRMADAEAYREECGSCHLPYPAKFLPARSWERMMSGLDDHFGEDASLDERKRAELLAYLSASSASNHTRYLARLEYNAVPMRITELPYFVRKHDEVPERMVTGNPEVGSFSQCDSCHRDAARGKFNEHEVDIPGFGRWDD